MLTQDSIRKTDAIVHEIVLGPLSLADVNQLLRDTLRCELVHAEPLAELVHEKTGGNPFFAIQFLTTLAEEYLLEFDAREAVWRWDVNRIRAKGFTDNVAELMVAKLKRLPDITQEALRQLACLGHSAEITSLAIVQGKSEKELHSDLWEAARGGFVLRQGESYKFVHDRVQEAAYALIPEELRAQFHLSVGRLMIAKMTPEQIADKIFDIVNQLNSGLALISDPDEKERVAELNLKAGRKAKASTAYASACIYLSAGMDLLGSNAWEHRYELGFGLWLERAECEYLNGNFEKTEELAEELLFKVASKVDNAAAYRLKILLQMMRAEYRQAVDTGLECLRLFGIQMPAHPTREQVQAAYEKIWLNLGRRSIESLIDLPLMTDPEKQAAMRVLSVLASAAFFTDSNLFYLLVYQMAKASLKYGTTDASVHGYADLALILGPIFHRYPEGYRFAKLACSLVEKYGFHAYKARAYYNMEQVGLWTQPVRTAIDFIRLAFRACIETHDVTYACYCCNHLVTDLLLQGVPLEEVWREAQKGLEFVRKVKYRDVADVIVSQQRFILNLRGHTAAFSTFSDAEFDEESFEARLTNDRMPNMACWYWILKLQARFLSGDYEAAGRAGKKAKALLWSSEAFIESANYHFYHALTIAALQERAPRERHGKGIETLKRSLKQLQEWSGSCRETFLDKYALVSAEIARVEGRDIDAMRLYEEAIRAAREHGFVQNEGLANELAAQFYLKRGIEKVAHSYLREAQHSYLRWGAVGKVQQLDERYPAIEEQAAVRPTTTIGTPVEQLDLGTVMKASQAVSGEIVLEKLIETLMVIALEHAGAE